MKVFPIGLVLAGMTAAFSCAAAIVTVTTVDNTSLNDDGKTSLLEALRQVQANDTIAFDLPGPGPYFIGTPIGGYPLITSHGITIDGYSQPGSFPNTNSITDANSARIQIILDSTGFDTAFNTNNPSLPLRRSTRLVWPEYASGTGYDPYEATMFGVFGADNVTIRGLSFLARHTEGSPFDPRIYAIALINQATNARVQGCWFGLAPGAPFGGGLLPVSSAVAAFRWRVGGDVFSAGLVFGTDGDGIRDREEFNIVVGTRIGLALELPGSRISGNFFNLFPDGRTFVDVDSIFEQQFSSGDLEPTVESIEIGRVADGAVIGTNGDGISDADERNVFAHSVYQRNIEFYTAARNVVVAGNLFGVGVDGTTFAPVSRYAQPDLISLPNNSSIRIGTDGDGISDDLEGNIIHRVPGTRFCAAAPSVPIVARGNVLTGNQFHGVPFAESDLNNRTFAPYYAPYVLDSTLGVPPVLSRFTNGILSGWFAPGNATYGHVSIDICRLDDSVLSRTNLWPFPFVHSSTRVISFRDNDGSDLDPDTGHFSVNLGAYGIEPTALVAASVTYSRSPSESEAGGAVTSPLSNPIAASMTLHIRTRPPGQIEVWWFGPQNQHHLQSNPYLELDNWFDLFGENYSYGRNWQAFPIESDVDGLFFRLAPR